jgi:hypothetical protein
MTLRTRLRLESLEVREVPAAYTSTSAADLIADIRDSNRLGGTNTITLQPHTTFTLTAVNNTADGPTGLPVVAAGNHLTILGNGDTIQRNTNVKAAFRLFDVAAGAALTLRDVTLTGGLSDGPGGAIFNRGNLTLQNAIVEDNTARPAAGWPDALGGGIWSAGVLVLTGTTVRNNQALGSHGLDGKGGAGGSAFGGGVYVSGGTAELTGVILSGNTAQGGAGGSGSPGRTLSGNGGDGGGGYGGGMSVGAGTATLRDTTATGNAAIGGAGGTAGVSGKTGKPGRKGHVGAGLGGGTYIESDASIALDAFTVAHITGNQASKVDPNISGAYSPVH